MPHRKEEPPEHRLLLMLIQEDHPVIPGQDMLPHREALHLLITEALRRSTGEVLHLLIIIGVIIPHHPGQGAPLLPTALRAEAPEAAEGKPPVHQEEVQEEGINSLFFFHFFLLFSSFPRLLIKSDSFYGG
jgi:hypothetical protein